MNERLVQDIYHKGVIFCRPDTPLQEVIRVMADTDIHAIIVAAAENTEPLGIIAHIDAIAHYGEDLSQISAAEVMNSPVATIPESALVREAAKKMRKTHFHRLLVVDAKNTPVGILSTTDIIRDMRGSKRVWYVG